MPILRANESGVLVGWFTQHSCLLQEFLCKFKKNGIDEWVKAGGAADIAGSDKSE